MGDSTLRKRKKNRKDVAHFTTGSGTAGKAGDAEDMGRRHISRRTLGSPLLVSKEER